MPSPDEESLAPRWHTAILIALICAVAVTGAVLTRTPPAATVAPGPPASAASRIASIYAPMVVVQWSLLVYVCRIGRPRNALASLLGARLTGLRGASTDVALALAGWLLVVAFQLGWVRVFGLNGVANVRAMLPRSAIERVAWVVVAVSAGFCEEVVYRGYLQTQLTAFTRRPSLAIALQAALFGIAHGDQGLGAVVRVAIYGVAFGALARWRRSLLPGIVCHVWTDVASGLLRG